MTNTLYIAGYFWLFWPFIEISEILMNFYKIFLKTVDFGQFRGGGIKKISWCRGGSQIRFAVGGLGFRAGVGG